MFHRIEFERRYLAEDRQTFVQHGPIRRDRTDQLPKIFAIDALGLRVVGELLMRVLPGARIDLQLIERLQSQPARQLTGTMHVHRLKIPSGAAG